MRIFLFTLSLFLFIGCGEAESDESSEENGGEVSSVVETTNPDNSIVEDVVEVASEDVGDDIRLTQLSYPEDQHNFGTVFYPSENRYTFKVKNTGSNILIIEKVSASCGCTVPNKPEEPIAPGEVGEIDVIFRPKKGQVGQTITKRITVVANTEPADTYLTIMADVIEGM